MTGSAPGAGDARRADASDLPREIGNEASGAVQSPSPAPVPTSTRAPTFTAKPAHRSGAENDRAALVALYNTTDGPNWSRNTNWLTDLPIGQWDGVTTDESGRVTRLAFIHGQLTGEIPAELGSLANLQVLDLEHNQLRGRIPTELGNLTNLQRLLLNSNQLSGRIPPELGNLTNLQYLYLYLNQLSGQMPPELGNLTNLQGFLSINQLSGRIPPELGNLTNLRRLLLYGNQLSGRYRLFWATSPI